MQRLAADFCLSDVGFSKLCRKHEIPTPRRGYWMKTEAQQKALCPRLRRADTAGADEVVIQGSRTTLARAGAPEPKNTIEVIVPTELLNPRPIVELTARSLTTSKRGVDGLVASRAKTALPIRIAPQSIDRTAYVLDALVTCLALLNCLEERGHSFAI